MFHTAGWAGTPKNQEAAFRQVLAAVEQAEVGSGAQQQQQQQGGQQQQGELQLEKQRRLGAAGNNGPEVG